MQAPAPYPLLWPESRKRRPRRVDSQFKTTLAQAITNVKDSLRRFAQDSSVPVEDVVITSNASLGITNPADPAVAVWYRWDDSWCCIPVDRYSKVQDNLQAIHHCIEADRTKLRHAGIEQIRADYVGRLALPFLSDKPRPWRQVLQYEGQSLDECKQQYLKLMRTGTHPDHGGSHDDAAALNKAFEEAELELRPRIEGRK
ncbi:MAG: J domain-containing protein [Gammaproteobacteria bacterium]|nr:J domain-containing protein [Gammaproteobacteria bacterium]